MSYLAMLRAYTRLYTQELLLVVHGGPCRMLGIEPRSAACKDNVLSTVLLLLPHLFLVRIFNFHLKRNGGGYFIHLSQVGLLRDHMGCRSRLGLSECMASALPAALLL